ncbi:MAG: efflux RND transporter periplasmic adaptor subunit [Acidobacteriaceae bacterium]|nr:efflux RND transporter periplasmic adaptor subunit [Acidobacteriaceae bacterium]
MNRKIKPSRAMIVFAVASLLAVSGCRRSDDEKAVAALVSVQAAKPEQGPIAESIKADAILTPIAQAAIAPKITAPVERFYVQRGSHVKAGQLLATLENRDLAAAMLDNKGAFQAAQAAYAAETKAQVPEDLQKAQLDVAQAKASLELNQSIVAARKQLFAQGAIPGRDLDTATAQLVQAQAAYDTAARHLESLESVSHEAALKQAAGQLTSAKGKYKGAEAMVSYTEIRSPINGVVTDRPLFAGETAVSGTALLTVMDTSTLIAKVHVAQAVAQRMKVGDDATITVPSVAEPVPAKVTLVSPALDAGSTTVEIWLRIENRDGTYKVGTPVQASIRGRSVAAAMKIPSSAVLTAQDGSTSVMVVGVDGSAHRRPVTLGINDGTEVQVIQGLAASDAVITTGAFGLDEGTKVKIGAAGKDEDDK